jgi:hypothetical protein
VITDIQLLDLCASDDSGVLLNNALPQFMDGGALGHCQIALQGVHAMGLRGLERDTNYDLNLLYKRLLYPYSFNQSYKVIHELGIHWVGSLRLIGQPFSLLLTAY